MRSSSEAATERLKSWELLLEDQFSGGGARWVIRCFNRLDSTMDAARELAPELQRGEAGLVLAAMQRRGRGRQGREWRSPESGFFATYVFEMDSMREDLSALSLVCACEVCDVLRELGCAIVLKWPNDVVTEDGRKLSGSLIDVVRSNGRDFVLVGIGINLAGAPADAGAVVSIQELSGRTIAPLELAGRLSGRLRDSWQKFSEAGFAQFRDRWLARAGFLGKLFIVDSGGDIVRGVFRGVDQRGRLLLQCAGGGEAFGSAHVLEIKEAPLC